MAIRLRVDNKRGRRQAVNARAQLQKVWVFVQTDEWADLSVDVTPLRWASRAQEGDSGAAHTTVIPSGLSDYVEFAFWDDDTRALVVRQARQETEAAMQRFRITEFRFQVAVTADGTTPKVRVVRVRPADRPQGSTEFLEVIDFSEAPNPLIVRSQGIYGVLAQSEPDLSLREKISKLLGWGN